MLQIENKDRFGKVIADSLSKVEQTVTDAKTKTRWIRAIAKAVVEIEENVFMTWQEADKSLLIWSQKSNNIYTSNGVCQCRAFEQGSPCFHRAAARLIRLYLETEDATVQAEEIPYLKPTVQVKAERIAGIRIN
ncbi:MAG: hypothetical protein H0X72_03320 [Acidobacteria bacterium]|jgi:hypothetical protein|nr:hypothetical protein [Acidobacteriota bacterium]